MPSVTRRRAPNPDRRASVETQVLAATERLLVEGASFTDLGVQRIAAEAGVARSTFYTHFRDKSELLMRLAGTMRTAGFDIASAWDPATGPDALAEAFQRVVGIYRRHAAVLAAVNEVAAYDTTVREFWRSGLNRFIEHTERVLTAEQRSGRAPAGVEVGHASRVIVIGGEAAIADHVATFPDDTAGDAAFARELAAIWWHGVYRRGTPTA
ncbi:TetR/AcrR family transcriptional regulator [Plantactinospora sp. S1510]|uniref:TetR/AcrR family transcriptional regulator n=1 Tax=Plantactinospora alkalitolerans TaxID=2789879 RepID=A0ABS0H788_9ACTN|nr:TetR/AcrR family transcriptional regulator [Plantactinospora alkalitolerans]MBF9134323.1 TetR/AcrR family transcriptional regulator [Plantactinospora alkalitolerans]